MLNLPFGRVFLKLRSGCDELYSAEAASYIDLSDLRGEQCSPT